MDLGLRDQVVLVTGASGGIGSAIAQAFAAEGARVIIHYRTGRARAQTLCRELGDSALCLPADLRREPAVKRLFAEAVRRCGRLDVLVANAAAWEDANVPFPEMSLRQWNATLNAVLTSAFLCLREFAGIVARQQRGNAVIIGSTAAIFGEARHADYAAAKAALAFGLTRTLKNEFARLAPHTADYCGGRVNCVCPGWTLVPRTAAKLRQPATVQRVTATMALPKVGRPEDIAGAVAFLASDRCAGHITGQTLVIAGGMEGRWLWQPDEVDPRLA